MQEKKTISACDFVTAEMQQIWSGERNAQMIRRLFAFVDRVAEGECCAEEVAVFPAVVEILLKHCPLRIPHTPYKATSKEGDQ